MDVRRVVLRLLFPMAVVLPVWLLIGRGILFDGGGWEFVGYLILCPILFVALLVIGGLIRFRPGMRAAGAVSWMDVAGLGALWLLLALAGFLTHPAVAALAVAALLVVFWLSVWQFVQAGRRRVQEVMDDIDATVNGARASVYGPAPVDVGEVIVVTSTDVAPPVTERPVRGDTTG